jgi:hypothetical protein
MGALTSIAALGLNAALAARSASNERREINAERDRQIAEIQARDAEVERERQAALRRTLAAQRARLGAAGVGGAGGSAEAVLRGLTEESERERAARQDASSRRIGEARATASGRRRSNLLDLTGQLTQAGLSALGRSRSTGRSLLDL